MIGFLLLVGFGLIAIGSLIIWFVAKGWDGDEHFFPGIVILTLGLLLIGYVVVNGAKYGL